MQNRGDAWPMRVCAGDARLIVRAQKVKRLASVGEARLASAVDERWCTQTSEAPSGKPDGASLRSNLALVAFVLSLLEFTLSWGNHAILKEPAAEACPQAT